MLNRLIIVCFLSISTTTSFAEEQVNSPGLSVWANEAIVSTYTYNYSNFLERQKQIAHFYTVKGWIAYSKALNDSKLVDEVKKNEYRVSAVATKPPEIKKIGNDLWEAVMPMLVFYQNPQYQQKQHLEVTINFGRAPSGQGVRGLAINKLLSKVTKPICRCESND